MSGLADLVNRDAVLAQLTARDPDILDESNERANLFVYALDGIAAEVAAVVGGDGLPPAGVTRDLAVQAVVLGTAMSVESSLFPEQINGDSSRAEQLRDRYVALLAQLRLLFPQAGVTPPTERSHHAVTQWLA